MQQATSGHYKMKEVDEEPAKVGWTCGKTRNA